MFSACTFLLLSLLSEGGPCWVAALPQHLHDPLPPGSVLLRRLDIISSQQGEREEREEGSLDFYGQTRKWDNHICSRVLRQLPPVAASTLHGGWKTCPQGWSSLVPFHRQALVPLPSAPSALLSCPRGDFLDFAGGACSTPSFQLHSAHPHGASTGSMFPGGLALLSPPLPSVWLGEKTQRGWLSAKCGPAPGPGGDKGRKETAPSPAGYFDGT